MTPVLAVSADSVSAGPLGLLVVVLMIIATALLIRNMNGRLRRLPPQFPEQKFPSREVPPDELPPYVERGPDAPRA